jgi:glutamine cyclotransferase
MYKKIIPVLVIWGLCSCSNSGDTTSDTAAATTGTEQPAANTPPSVSAALLPFKVTATHPHDTTLFTEGLFVHDGKMYESTGSPDNIPFTKSMIGILNLKTGKLDKKIELDRNIYFGEGIVLLNNKIYQLTYQNQKGFIYDANTFQKTGEFNFANKEGWGFTTDGKKLIMSDGTPVLTFLNPDNLKPEGTLAVKENGNPVNNLNELEYINGFIYANIWLTNYIAKIDPATGNVVGKLNMNELNADAKAKYRNAQEMNGIAYDAATDKIYVTGKLWPDIYQVEFAH